MLAFLKIGVAISLVINCAWLTETAEKLSNSMCENNVCNCSFGTQETVLRGIKYCLRSCPEHAVRLSDRICECRNGYEYIDEERSKCVRTSELGDDHENILNDAADASIVTILTTASSRSKITTIKTSTSATSTATESYGTTPAASKTTNRGDILNVNDMEDIEDIYLWIGALLMAVVLVVLLAFVCIARK